MADQESSAASGSTGPRRDVAGARGGRDPPTPRAEVNRLAQAAFRQRQKVREQVSRCDMRGNGASAPVSGLSGRAALIATACAAVSVTAAFGLQGPFLPGHISLTTTNFPGPVATCGGSGGRFGSVIVVKDITHHSPL